MKTRIISACIMAPLFILVVMGGLPLFAACFAVAALGMHELYNGWTVQELDPCRPLGYISLVLLYLIVYLSRYRSQPLPPEQAMGLISFWLVFTVCAALCVSLFDKGHEVFRGPLGALGVLYPGLFSVHLALVQNSFGDLVYYIFLFAFGSDTFAYFSGYFFGKHKLCPDLSPKKTVEGAVGGVLGTALCTFALSSRILPQVRMPLVIMSLFASVISMFGDLVASAFKRKMGIKDYSNLIPGHGGIMDRFDSVLFVAPFVYYCFLFLTMADPGLLS